MRKNALLKLAVIFILSFFSLAVLAQTGKIKGTVSGKSGPLAGASISAGSRGALTNSTGEFEISIRPVKAGETSSVSLSLVEGVNEEQEIVLVGSRVVAGRSKLSTPVPVDIIGPKELKGYAQTDITQALLYAAPSFNAPRTTIADGTDHIDPASLRGLGPDQVLVL
jgi:iron complex outermembrane receptor protein